MAVPLPELDDRSFQDLADEARSLLVTLAPALTNHNPSDPLVTISELFAFFADILLFRLNTVTDANRTAFLRLLNGPGWTPPADPAQLNAEVRRTVNALRSVERAVTTADYELLARAADPGIARAHCIAGFDLSQATVALRAKPTRGTVSMVIVPRVFNPDNTQLPEPLRTAVAAALEPRRLLTTRVQVVGARFVPLRVRVTVRVLADAAVKGMQNVVKQALERYLHPLIGRAGDGWPLGRNVNVSEIYQLIDSLPGVDYVQRSRDPNSEAELDELIPTAEFAGRLQRNDAGEQICMTLLPGELVLTQLLAQDITVLPAVTFD